MEMTRRKMFAATSAAALTTFTRSALGGWEPSERYPDPAIKSLDASFNRYRLFNASGLRPGCAGAKGQCISVTGVA